MNSSSMEKIFGKFEVRFFKELKFMELEYYRKLEYPKSDKFLHIYERVVDWYIYFNKRIGPINQLNLYGTKAPSRIQ